ncbi:alpha/beta hydrolase [Sphingobium sp. TB-6]|uniref:alpha/beta fold hydrolase n=1 Tax=Sphingobium sp. TB-6 TaxID=2728850 RepID=UPI0019D042A9|nr:alpha/beta hydrolase [Sphingobium sp. TB-6]
MHESIWSDLTGVSFTQGYIDAGGTKTRYVKSGDSSKPVLILLHGTSGHAEAYSRNMAAHGEHFDTWAIDMIGHGWSDYPETTYEIPTYAEHVLRTMDAIGKEKAHISGESLGGWVATHLAVHHPDRVDKVVLNTAGGWVANPEVMERIKKVSNAAADNPTWETVKARLEFLMYDKSMVNDDLIECRRRIFNRPGYSDVTRRILCLQEMDVRKRNLFTKEQYGSIQSPTLVLWTSHDPTATVEQGREIASMIPGSEFVVMDKCGHWPQFENADEFNRIHVDFLTG